MITRDNLLDALRQKLKMQAKPVKYRGGGEIAGTVDFDIRQVRNIISLVLDQLRNDGGEPVYIDTINDKEVFDVYNGLAGQGKIVQFMYIDEDQNYIEVFGTVSDLTQGETLVYISVTNI